MNLEDFRKELESDARIENEELKKQLDKLRIEKSNKMQRLEHDLRCMCNRCYVFTHGCMCDHCHLLSNFKCDYQKGVKPDEVRTM